MVTVMLRPYGTLFVSDECKKNRGDGDTRKFSDILTIQSIKVKYADSPKTIKICPSFPFAFLLFPC
jgi:hypothetical protein